MWKWIDGGVEEEREWQTEGRDDFAKEMREKEMRSEFVKTIEIRNYGKEKT